MNICTCVCLHISLYAHRISTKSAVWHIFTASCSRTARYAFSLSQFGAGQCNVLQCGAVCCSMMQRVAACCSVVQCIIVWYSVVQCVAVCCSVLLCIQKSSHLESQCIAVCCNVLRYVCSVLRRVDMFAVCCSVCCSVVQCIIVCCSVLQCAALYSRVLSPQKKKVILSHFSIRK